MDWKRIYPMVFVGMLLYGTAGAAQGAADVAVSPASLQIGILFAGAEVGVSGSVAAGREVVIEVIGPEEKGKFKIKDKVGPFWMNRRQVEIKQAPCFYELLLPQDASAGDLPIPGIGVANLKKNIAVLPDELHGDQILDQFVQLKRAERLYVGPADTIRYADATQGRKRFSASFQFPASIAQGEYQVVTTIVYNGRVEDSIIRKIQVQEAGIVKWIHELAFRHALVYGLMAVLIALVVGTVMGVVFKGGKAH